MKNKHLVSLQVYILYLMSFLQHVCFLSFADFVVRIGLDFFQKGMRGGKRLKKPKGQSY